MTKILFYPTMITKQQRLRHALDALGVECHNDTSKSFDLAFYWSFHGTVAPLDEFCQKTPMINKGCDDITKGKVNRIFKNIGVDPLTYKGKVVEKTENQALKKWRVIDCPIKETRDGFAYQKYIDSFDGNYHVEYRVFYAGEAKFVAKTYKKKQSQPIFDTVEILPVSIFYEDQLGYINNGCADFGLDFGEVDIKMDSNGDIYVLDINNVAGGMWIELWVKTVMAPYTEMVDKYIKSLS